MDRNRLELNHQERKTFRLHLAYTVIEAIIKGVLVLNEFVFVKSLHGSSYQLGVLFQFSMVVFVFLIFINEILRRVQNKRKMLRLTAVITRAPLLFIALFPVSHQQIISNSSYHIIFLAIFLIYYLASPVIFPTINLFLKSVYRHEKFGQLYSYATTVEKVVMLVVTFGYGLLLDWDNFAFVWILPVMAILGVGSVFLLSRIPYNPEEQDKPVLSFYTSVKASWFRMFNILKTNKPYLHFEWGFMFYGFAFMSTVTVITLFFEHGLHLNYSSVAFYKNAYNIGAILLLPFFGRLLGKIDPRIFAAITFSSMLLYIGMLIVTEYFPYHIEIVGIQLYVFLIPYIIFHSVFAATMSLLWSIGSAYFCPSSEAGDYQSVHLFLTGSRALFAPLAGVMFYELLGFKGTFAIGVILLGIGIVLMIWSYNKEK